MVEGKRTGKLEVTSKPTLRKVVKLVPGGEGSHQSRVGIEDIKNDMLKMMDKIDILETNVRILAKRVSRLDGMAKE